ncbi:xylulokinase [Streptosporangium pseudovulgare]|uniref:Xylulose kinase n=1 Tax=Streptosporangium pseudovulgare TaxID=35765 RepID=A0ABQ2R3X3_9ACTN|nr:xylulokinase [Streptosporangium pseudovulgare]GGQ12377.1 xylulokinase [Streptosporangium pseudovulgare]
MTLVAGVDSSTQSCKVVIRDAETGALVRQGRAAHPDGTEVAPAAWWAALQEAVAQAGGLDDVAAVSVAAQQHGMVCLDESGRVVRDALLWNDTRSAGAARDLVEELGGPERWAEAVGSVPVASFTVAKLRWLAVHEPEAARRTARVCLPHDWLTWRLGGGDGEPVTDRGDASGTGYFSPATGSYRTDLLKAAFGAVPGLPRVLGPREEAGELRVPGSPGASGPVRLAPGTGDNMAAALGVGAGPGDVVVSIGTSGTAFAVAERPSADPTGAVAGFADATGRFLPLVCTLNAARVLDAAARLLGVGPADLDRLALQAPAGAGGLVCVPYLEGERTPNLPEATGTLHGLTLATSTPAHLARAAVEGMLCHLADAFDALGLEPARVLLIGGGARSEAVRRIAPAVFGRPVVVPEPGEYVADGAARQAAWLVAGGDEPPVWDRAGSRSFEADAVPEIRARYAEARARYTGGRDTA